MLAGIAKVKRRYTFLTFATPVKGDARIAVRVERMLARIGARYFTLFLA